MAADQKATVVSAGSEQAIRVGKTVISRPFGVELVDRLAVVGSYPVKGAQLHLIRGTSAGDCPARYAVIVARPGQAPQVGQSFGTCSTAAQPRLRRGEFTVAMPASPAGGPLVQFHYANGRMHPRQATLTQGAGITGTATTPTPAVCRPAHSIDAAAQAAAIDGFERDWPKAYRRTGSLKKITFSQGQMRRLTTDLACMASWPAGDRRVAELATPLFRSKQHRAAAFAALESVQRDPDADANLKAVTRSFSAEMRYRVALDPVI
ncbi:hypothetical protein RZN05_09575 [Sphingomonas sp. HF-S4]|uniref:DUF4476 domain-containing protein n=1 Tax=Sphingomonas agrestis TaxID=3080540 RepID=A0ABU3Y775_9SPHN|nr:hypothetical protein [Sphingomonas sp. HF-S4]MDV3457231.1 hypothetical protein [Sphingomonas sp. HF-S4]